jgi:lysophospholipase
LKWTEIPNRNQKIKDADVPWPIVIAVQRDLSDKLRRVDLDDPIFEFSLADFGTWKWGTDKKSQGAFTPIRYLGTQMENGKPSDWLNDKKNEKSCWEGFDQAG